MTSHDKPSPAPGRPLRTTPSRDVDRRRRLPVHAAAGVRRPGARHRRVRTTAASPKAPSPPGTGRRRRSSPSRSPTRTTPARRRPASSPRSPAARRSRTCPDRATWRPGSSIRHEHPAAGNWTIRLRASRPGPRRPARFGPGHGDRAADARTHTASHPDPDAEADTGSHPEAHPQADSQTDPEAGRDPEADREGDPEADRQTARDPEAGGQASRDPEADGQGGRQADRETESGQGRARRGRRPVAGLLRGRSGPTADTIA